MNDPLDVQEQTRSGDDHEAEAAEDVNAHIEEEVPPPPEVENLTFRESVAVSTIALVILAFIASVWVIYLAKPILLPVVFALLANFIFRPIHRRLLRLRLPRVPAAALIFLLVSGGTVAAAVYMSGPVMNWMDMVPRDMWRIEMKLRELRKPVERVTEAAQTMDQLTAVQAEEGNPEVEVQREPKVSDKVWAGMQSFAGYAVVVLILLFFVLAYGDNIYRRLAQSDEMSDYMEEIASSISSYLFTITLINAGLGVAIGISMYLLGMPNPLLWGIAGAVLNYVPYFGAITGVLVLAVVAFLSYEETYRVILPPLCYFALTSLEGNFITPVILGRRFTINPVVIFVWLIFWGWLWGVPGALIAVPLLMAFKISCDHIRPLLWVSYVISVGPKEQITGDPADADAELPEDENFAGRRWKHPAKDTP